MVPEALHTSSSVEWYTPGKYIEAAREVMGSITLDPASCAKANETVRAETYYDANSFSKRWYGNVWLNPPYGKTAGKSNQGIWFGKLQKEYIDGEVYQAIMLVNAQTAEKWFQPLWQYDLVFTDHRIHFVSPTDEKSQPSHGNVFIYMGPNAQKFCKNFEQFGTHVGPRYTIKAA